MLGPLFIEGVIFVLFPVHSKQIFSLGRITAASWLLLTVSMGAIGCSPREITLADLEAAAAKVDISSIVIDDGDVAPTSMLNLESSDLKFGFIKLTDCAPLVIAKEKGFFDDEGLNVTLEPQSNWKILLDNVINGQLEGAHMLAGQPIGATIGIGTQSPIVTAYSMDYNGNAITVSNAVWAEMQKHDPKLQSPTPPHPISADSLKPVVLEYLADHGQPFPMGMVFPVSTHNYEIRYWLAAAGIHPGTYTSSDLNGFQDAQVQLSTVPPPQMPQNLEADIVKGYCVGEPWNQKAVATGIGVPVITNSEIWKNNPEKVFGVSKAWADQHPNTHLAIIKALIRAGKWLDQKDEAGRLVNRTEAAKILSRKDYVGAEEQVIARSMTGTFTFQATDVQSMPDFNIFFRDNASYPHYSDCVWFLTQMRRWGQITEQKPAAWYDSVAKDIYKPEIYRRAAELLISEGHLDPNELPPLDYDGYRGATTEFIDGKSYDGRDPIGYINSFEIGTRDVL